MNKKVLLNWRSAQRVSLLLALMTCTLLTYENCSPGFTEGEISSNAVVMDIPSNSQPLPWDNSFEAYPYVDKPEFMAELDIGQTTAVDSNTISVPVRGVIVSVDDPAASVSYEVHWFRGTANACPVVMGQTVLGSTTIVYTCILNGPPTGLTGKIYAKSILTAERVLVRAISL